MLLIRLILNTLVILVGLLHCTYAHFVNSLVPEGVLIDPQVIFTTQFTQGTKFVKFGNEIRKVVGWKEYTGDHSDFELLFLEKPSNRFKGRPMERARSLPLEIKSHKLHTVKLYEANAKDHYEEYSLVENPRGFPKLTSIGSPNFEEINFTTKVYNSKIDHEILTASLNPKLIFASNDDVSDYNLEESIKSSNFIYKECNAPYEDTGDPKHLFDFYRPSNGKELPLLIFIHSGSWLSGSKEQFTNEAKKFAAELGYACATINYRLSPEHPYPASIVDAQRFIQYARWNSNKLGINPRKIIVLGYDMGGYIASALGANKNYVSKEAVRKYSKYVYMSPQPNAAINIAGPTIFSRDMEVLDNPRMRPLSKNTSNFIKKKVLPELIPNFEEVYEECLKQCIFQIPLIEVFKHMSDVYTGQGEADIKKYIKTIPLENILEALNKMEYSNALIALPIRQKLITDYMKGISEDQWYRASPMHLINKTSIPFYMICGINDVIVLPYHAEGFKYALEEEGGKAEVYALFGCDHFSFLNEKNMTDVDLCNIDTKEYDLRNSINIFLKKLSLSPKR